jgi:hypothetical protein
MFNYKSLMTCIVATGVTLFPLLLWAEGGGGGGDLGGQGGSGPEISTYLSLIFASIFLVFAYHRKNKQLNQQKVRVKKNIR